MSDLQPWALPEGFSTRIDFQPAFDRRDPNPAKNYGIGSMRMTFILLGPKGAVQWMISTEWFTESARQHLASFSREHARPHEPRAWDLGYHAKEPQYEGQEGRQDCHLLEGGTCYYDGSGLNAELLTERFIAEGVDYLWPALHAEYLHRFEEGPWPFAAEAAAAKSRGRFL